MASPKNMDFLVFGMALVGVLMGIPEVESLNAHIHLAGKYTDFIIEETFVLVGLEHDRKINQMKCDKSEVEGFTTDFSSMPSANVHKMKSGKSIADTLAAKEGALTIQHDGVRHAKLTKSD